MKTKTMFKSAIAAVAALAIATLGLVGCASNAPEDNPEDNPTIEATEGAENAEATNEQTEEATEAPSSGNDTEGATASDSGSNGAYTSSQGTSGGNSGAKSSGSSGGTQSAPKAQSTPSQPAHQHSWEPQYKTVTVTDQAAWTETIRGIRCHCGTIFTDKAAANAHTEATGHSCSSYHENVNHPAVTHTEQQLTGYKCACGATK